MTTTTSTGTTTTAPTTAGEPVTCPSADVTAATGVLGFRRPGELVTFLPRVVPVPDELRRVGWTGFHVRFTTPCRRSGCGQWDGGCQVATVVARDVHLRPRDGSGPDDCPIRPRCRWYLQEGPAICSACPEVVHSVHG